MVAVHIALGVALLACFTVAAAWGAWAWRRERMSRGFWRLLRVGQGLLVVDAAQGAALAFTGHSPGPSLHVIYGLIAIAVSFVAEQLRVASAEFVLHNRGLSSAGVRVMPPDQQRSVALAIVRREVGTMALAALVILGLCARAAWTGA